MYTIGAIHQMKASPRTNADLMLYAPADSPDVLMLTNDHSTAMLSSKTSVNNSVSASDVVLCVL